MFYSVIRRTILNPLSSVKVDQTLLLARILSLGIGDLLTYFKNIFSPEILLLQLLNCWFTTQYKNAQYVSVSQGSIKPSSINILLL